MHLEGNKFRSMQWIVTPESYTSRSNGLRFFVVSLREAAVCTFELQARLWRAFDSAD